MHHFARLTAYLSGPALFGLTTALILTLLFPEYLNITTAKPQTTNNHQLPTGPVSYAQAVKHAAPSVVNIYTLKEQPAERHYYPQLGRYSNPQSLITPTTGSGVIVSHDGYIITNLHVIESPKAIRVALQDGREAEPQIVGISEEDDMAILKIDLDNLQPIELGNPDSAQVGDVVLAIGNPFGVGQTVTQGIISGTRRKGLNIAHYENFLQTDAAINPGNSGGALIDAYGRLLGINIGDLRQTYSSDASGIGFAIPADRAIQTMIDIVEHGRVVRGWLGIDALDLKPQIVAELNLTGVLLTDIYLNGPADIAGLAVGDVMTAINGTAIATIADAIQEFGNLRPGDVIEIDIIRNNKAARLEAVLSAAPE